MTPERWEQIGQLYDEAREMEPGARGPFLDRACAGDRDLRREVESLLAAEASVGDFIAAPALQDAAELLAGEAPPEMVGKQLGHYQLLSLIGAGGMGEVYAAKDTRLGRKVAVKLLPAAVARDAERLRRFEQEARAVGMLNHPNVLTIHDIGTATPEDGGAPYIVSELLDGETLRERLKGGALAPPRAVDIALQVARGLAAAHERGLVHRDLKPENLFITRDGRVKILDFGLARVVEHRPAGAEATGPAFPVVRTDPGMVMGTAGYMAPEQVRGEEADTRADIFAFGVILYEMLAGVRPFRGNSAVETMSAILTEEAPPLPPLLGAQSPGLERVIRRCLEKRLEQRFQSASDLGFALEALTSSAFGPLASQPGGAAVAPPGSGAGEGTTTLPLPAGQSRSGQVGRVGRFGRVGQVGQVGWIGWSGWVVAGVLVLAAVALFVTRPRRPPGSPRIVPLTSFPGQKSNPVFSPEGRRIAFIWDGGGGDPGVYVKLIEAGTPLRLASDPHFNLAWSPDGSHVAFARAGSGGGIFTVPALGGSERKMADTAGPFAWSPDGKTLAVVSSDSPQEPFGISLISIETGERRKLIAPPAGSFGDTFPAFSPDGQILAFIRSPNFLVSDIYLVPVAGGEPKRLTTDNLPLGGSLAWTADGRGIVYSSARGDLPSLWRISAAGGPPRRLVGVGEYAYNPSVSRQGDRLVYVYRKIDRNIWRAPGPGSTAKEKAPVKLIKSTREDHSPNFSPDGKRIAFVSDRTGSKEIWVCASDGENQVQVTSFGGSSLGSPRWSPDGRQIAFDSRQEGQSDIYTVSAEGGRPRRVTTEASEDVNPSWSGDGRWIYFGSRRSGEWQIWKMPAEGGPATQVTERGGFEAFESQDGKDIYFAKREPGIWRVPAGGGEESRVFDRGMFNYWALSAQGIYFFNTGASPQPAIEFFNFATRQTVEVVSIERAKAPGGPPGIAVSRDGQWVLYWQADQIDNDIMLVDNFR